MRDTPYLRRGLPSSSSRWERISAGGGEATTMMLPPCDLLRALDPELQQAVR